MDRKLSVTKQHFKKKKTKQKKDKKKATTIGVSHFLLAIFRLFLSYFLEMFLFLFLFCLFFAFIANHTHITHNT